jgi:sugar phosphate isomerase/epimerase
MKDEHLWPGEGTIDWAATKKALQSMPTPPAAVLEINYNLAEKEAALHTRIEQAFELFG